MPKTPVKVLIVEDEPDILRQQKRLFEMNDELQIIGTATNGSDAVKLTLKLKPDVVLLDLGLPDINGIEVTRQIKSKTPEIEILIFTIFDEEEKVMAAIQAGAAGYLLKGARMDRMVSSIKDVAAGGSVIQPHLARHLLRHFQNAEKSSTNVKNNLTPRENEILGLIAKGLSNKDVAGVLGLSKATVRTHLEHIYAKLDVTNRTEAVTEGIKKGFISIDN